MKFTGIVGERVDLQRPRSRSGPRDRRSGPPPLKPRDRVWAERAWEGMTEHERRCVTIALGYLLGPPS